MKMLIAIDIKAAEIFGHLKYFNKIQENRRKTDAEKDRKKHEQVSQITLEIT